MIYTEVSARNANGATVPARALVDSGADRTLLPLAFTDDFEIDLDDMVPVDGQVASGAVVFQMWTHGVRVRLLEPDFELDLRPAYFGGVSVPLLGRRDFFASFRCGFDERAQRFWLESY